METMESSEAIVLLIVIAMMAILGICAIDLVFYKLLKKKHEIYLKKNEVHITSPMQIGFLVNNKILYNHIIAVVLYFIDKKYITLNEIVNEDKTITYELHKKDSNIFNANVYETINNINKKAIKKLQKKKVSVSDIYVINRIVFNDYEKVDINTIEKFYDDKDCKGKETEELKAKLIYLEKILRKEFVLYEFFHKNENVLTRFR